MIPLRVIFHPDISLWDRSDDMTRGGWHRCIGERRCEQKPEYVETVGDYTASALTLGQKAVNNLLFGPG